VQPETEQLLGSLECLLDDQLWFDLPYNDSAQLQPYVWDADQHGLFTPRHLLQVEGWIQATDLDVAIQDWQWSEQQGIAAYGMWFNSPLGCLDNDPEQILLDEATRLERGQVYEALQTLLKAELQDLQVFKIGCSVNYSLSVVIGKTAGNRWIGLVPNVPQETPFNEISICGASGEVAELLYSTLPESAIEMPMTEEEPIDPTLSKIQTLLKLLKPIRVYGWYDGGYDRTHDYGIVYAGDAEYDRALEFTLRAAGFFQIYQFHGCQFRGFDPDLSSNRGGAEASQLFPSLHRFLSQALSDTKLYRFCFWDLEQLYLIGQSGGDDRVGIVIRSQFEYNP